jgi:hypothetical protein
MSTELLLSTELLTALLILKVVGFAFVVVAVVRMFRDGDIEKLCAALRNFVGRFGHRP